MALVAAAAVAGAWTDLLRAGTAALLIGVLWFAVAFVSPGAVGVGDIRVAAVTAGLLGLLGWPAVLLGQLAASVTLLSVHVSEPSDGVAEVCACSRRRTRVAALAFRLQGHPRALAAHREQGRAAISYLVYRAAGRRAPSWYRVIPPPLTAEAAVRRGHH